MDKKKVNQIELQLEMRGYKRYTKNLIGNEDYAYMRTARDADGELKYIISHGFYDWEDYEGALENYGYTPTIVLGVLFRDQDADAVLLLLAWCCCIFIEYMQIAESDLSSDYLCTVYDFSHCLILLVFG